MVDRLVRGFLFLLLWFVSSLGVVSLVALVAVLGLGASTQDLSGANYGWLNWVSWPVGLALTFLVYHRVTRQQAD